MHFDACGRKPFRLVWACRIHPNDALLTLGKQPRDGRT